MYGWLSSPGQSLLYRAHTARRGQSSIYTCTLYSRGAVLAWTESTYIEYSSLVRTSVWAHGKLFVCSRVLIPHPHTI